MPLTTAQYQILILRELGQYVSSPNRTETNAELQELIGLYWDKRDAITSDERRYLYVKLDAIDALLGMQSDTSHLDAEKGFPTANLTTIQEGDEKYTFAAVSITNASLLRQVRADLALKLGIGKNVVITIPTRDTPTLGEWSSSDL